MRRFMHLQCVMGLGPAGIGTRALAAALIGSAGPVLAQETDVPVEVQETDRVGMGARATGMGLAMEAVADDATALFFNPAGLAQIGHTELSGGLQIVDTDRTITHVQGNTTSYSASRLEHLAMVFPIRTYSAGMAVAFAYQTLADLDMRLFKEGFLIEATPQQRGLFELEEFNRTGTARAVSGAIGLNVSKNLSIGGTLSLLVGDSNEQVTTANYRVTDQGDYYEFDLGSPGDPDERVYEELVDRGADLTGIGGSIGLLGSFGPGFRAGAVFDFPTSMTWSGGADFRAEDTEKIDTVYGVAFRDEITLPLSLRGGLSWTGSGLLASGSVRWTDYGSIDFEGPILAPPGPGTFQRESAYRSVWAVNLGLEYLIPRSPVKVRAGFYTEPLPYRLIAADTDFTFVPSGPDETGTSTLTRDYPQAVISSDRSYWTAGAGVILQKVLILDAAYARGSWERSTPGNYENSTTFYPTTPTTESVTTQEIFITARVLLD